MTTVLYCERIYSEPIKNGPLDRPDVTILRHDVSSLADLPEAACEKAEGLMIFRCFMPAEEFKRFPHLRAIVRMGVGYDRIDRQEAARRGILVCNVPDYGTTEVADHAISMALALRRGLLLHQEAQRSSPPAAWAPVEDPLLRRISAQTFAIVGLGRIGTAAALRARGLGFRVVFHDPYMPRGIERALGIERAETLGELLRQADVLSLHTPLTSETRGLIGKAEIGKLPAGAVVINTARGPCLDIDALGEAIRSGHVAGAGLDVIPQEPPRDPVPDLLRAYRERAPWVEGRVIVTPHAAFCSPEAEADLRRRAQEIMLSALLTSKPQCVIDPASE